jgi:hypothetical protein
MLSPSTNAPTAGRSLLEAGGSGAPLAPSIAMGQQPSPLDGMVSHQAADDTSGAGEAAVPDRPFGNSRTSSNMGNVADK